LRCITVFFYCRNNVRPNNIILTSCGWQVLGVYLSDIVWIIIYEFYQFLSYQKDFVENFNGTFW